MAESAPQGMPALGLRQRPRGGRGTGRGRALVRGLGISFIIMLGSSTAAMILFGDEVERALETLVVGGPTPMPRPAPPMVAVPVPESSPPAAPETVIVVLDPPAETPAVLPGAVDSTTTGPEATDPKTTDPKTTDIAQLMAAARAVQSTEPPAEPTPSPTLTPTLAPGERGGPVPLVGLDAPQVTNLPPEDLAEDLAAPPADPEAPVLPPEPRTLEEVMAERRRIDQARALAPSVVVDRPEARRAGAANVVNVNVPTPGARDTVAEAYRALLRGDYHSALTSYDTVLTGDPRSLQALLGRAATLHKLRRLDEARHAYERVLALDSTNREALTNLLAILGAAAPQEALERLQALERAAPDFTPVLAQIALVYGQLGLDGQAVGYLRRAVAQDPGNLPYRYNLAILLDRSGQRQAAAEAYRAVLDGLRAGSGSGDLAVSADSIKARLDFLIAAR